MSKKKHGIRLKDFVEAYGLEDRVDEIKNVLKEWRDKHISQITQYIEEEDKDFLVEFYELSERSIESQEPQESKKIFLIKLLKAQNNLLKNNLQSKQLPKNKNL
jgi:hypothetical protein